MTERRHYIISNPKANCKVCNGFGWVQDEIYNYYYSCECNRVTFPVDTDNMLLEWNELKDKQRQERKALIESFSHLPIEEAAEILGVSKGLLSSTAYRNGIKWQSKRDRRNWKKKG